jgi:hypothetical protein
VASSTAGVPNRCAGARTRGWKATGIPVGAGGAGAGVA